MGPLTFADGFDSPRSIDELVPGVAAVGDDLFVGLEDDVGEPVVSQVLPDVFDRIEFRRSWRQRDEDDVVGDRQIVGDVPAGLIEKQESMGARVDLGRDFLQMALHGRGIAAWEHEGGASAAFGTDGAEDVG